MNVSIIIFLAVQILPAGTAMADERESLRLILRHQPVPASERPAARDSGLRQTGELKLLGAALLDFYQAFISPLDASACPFQPTCSEYAKQAVSKYGLIAGMVMAADRLTRCNGLGLRYYPRDSENRRALDPP